MRRLTTAAVALALAVVGFAGVAGATFALRAELRPAFAKDGLLVILAIGSDIGPPHRPGDPLRGRADGVHLLAVDTAGRRATIVDLPRDSFIGGNKVNAYLTFGGPEALEAQLEAYTGIPIDYWALTSFRGIENLVDGLGGVDVIVDVPMSDPFSGSNFAPGPQTLAGHQALAYVRDRHSVPGGDFGRTRHHGDLMRFVHAQVTTRQSDLPTLTRLVALFARNTVTNIPPEHLLPLALLATQIPPENVLQVPIGGSTGNVGGQSVVFPAPGDTFERILSGQTGP